MPVPMHIVPAFSALGLGQIENGGGSGVNVTSWTGSIMTATQSSVRATVASGIVSGDATNTYGAGPAFKFDADL